MTSQSEVPLNSIVLKIQNGTVAKQNTEGRGYKVSRIETISDGSINPDRVRYVQLSDDDLNKWRIKLGDILFSHINSVDHIGKSAIFNGNPEILIHGMNLLLLRPDASKVIPEYLAHFLKTRSARDFIRSRCKRAINQASINQRELGSMPVRLPPLDKQKRIVNILNRATNIERLRAQAEERLQEFIPALFNKIFGEPAEKSVLDRRGKKSAHLTKQSVVHRPLAEVADVIRGVTFKKSDSFDFPLVDRTPVLRAGNIGQELDLDRNLVWVPSKLVSPTQTLRLRDIVMCTSSGSATVVGKSASLRREWNGTVGAFCVVIRTKSTLCDPDYFAVFLRSAEFRSWTQNSAGANIKNIRKSDLESYPIPLPPLDEQKKFTKIVKLAQTTSELANTGSHTASELTASLMSQLMVTDT